MAMDVSQQVLKHLPRDARETVPLIDRYCQDYQSLFPEVRSYECFKSLHLGLLSPLKRKSLPEIAKIIRDQSSQSLHHFLSHSPWLVSDLKAVVMQGNVDLQPSSRSFVPFRTK